MLIYVNGDATIPAGSGRRIIAHICNDVGKWGAGFVVAVSRRWQMPEARYRAWARGELGGAPFELGRVQFVRVEDDVWVANMIAQHDIRAIDGVPPIRYDALATALQKVGDRALALGASVHMPRIGCGLAGGTWEQIGPLVEQYLAARGIAVTVYDFTHSRTEGRERTRRLGRSRS